ncbi:helix-turn-helix domain-containing protein [Paralcaligenes ureilyticus]|uniref:HTH-type transcriptional regulator/antitoxin HigA n=1 Tax=Paralcaligenes ureilyticus TaxID=627131 RepID=A0A4R3LTC8_9BURK|nr:transcriptional regulator [Paralcaligenes ureilyticus]TCT03792.1 HTH-type transcriptional regulator/antitoxin HigA [Paralcaligenes ureilyticus]
MEAVMDKTTIAEITSHFQALSSVVPLHSIHTAHDYDQAVVVLNQLLDAGAASEQHPLAELANTLGSLIGEFDHAHYPAQEVSPLAMLRFLIEQHHLTQSDLPEIGTQGVVSEILHGKRDLNVRQIKALSKRFHVPPNVFV